MSLKTKSQSADPSTLDWTVNRNSKRLAGDIGFRLIRHWVDYTKKLKILTLPAGEWAWEHEFVRWFKGCRWVQFTGIEKDPEVWKRMKRDLTQNKMSFGHFRVPCAQPISFEQFAGHTSWEHNQFNMINLDGMGTWGGDKVTQITQVFRNRMLVKGGIFQCTMALVRGQAGRWEHLKDNLKNSYSLADIRGVRVAGEGIAPWRLAGVASEIIRLAWERGYNLELLGIQIYHNYRGVKHSPQPEGVFIFQETSK